MTVQAPAWTPYRWGDPLDPSSEAQHEGCPAQLRKAAVKAAKAITPLTATTLVVLAALVCSGASTMVGVEAVADRVASTALLMLGMSCSAVMRFPVKLLSLMAVVNPVVQDDAALEATAIV